MARAATLYEDALAMRGRGEYAAAIARLREVARLDPNMTDAFAEMGGIFYLLGDFNRALSAYDIALAQRPVLRSALQGSAKVYKQRHDYNAAAQRLRTILRYNPNDAEIWMNLGDIAIYQGDEMLARDCYKRASEIDPEQHEVIEAARKRLALMQEVSRSYRPPGR
jgi:cytochrome c-type biogenesis protein CcmH/NrfG